MLPYFEPGIWGLLRNDIIWRGKGIHWVDLSPKQPCPLLARYGCMNRGWAFFQELVVKWTVGHSMYIYSYIHILFECSCNVFIHRFLCVAFLVFFEYLHCHGAQHLLFTPFSSIGNNKFQHRSSLLWFNHVSWADCYLKVKLGNLAKHVPSVPKRS